MLTSFEAISLYAVLGGLSGLSIGRWLLPSGRGLDRAWEDGRSHGRGEVWRDGQRRVRNGQVYRLGQHGGPAWCDAGSQWDRDGANAYYGWETDDDRSREDSPDARAGGSLAGDEAGDRIRASHQDEAERPAPSVPHAAPTSQMDAGPAALGVPSGLRAEVHQQAMGIDWADELGGIRTQIAVDDATEVLTAQQDPPSPGSFEYYLSDWQQKFDHWLAGEMAGLAAKKRELERRTA